MSTRAYMLLASVWLVTACQKGSGDKPVSDDATRVQENTEATGLVDGTDGDIEAKNVIYRRPRVLINSLAKILVLDKSGMCMELGELPCRIIHSVSLGGVSAYNHSQYTYRTNIPITAPISLERIVLSACTQRASLDFINPHAAVIYKDLDFSVDGRLVDNAGIESSITNLFHRAKMRTPNSKELAEIKKLYQEIYDTQPRGAAVNWMILSCFSVLTSIEGVFY